MHITITHITGESYIAAAQITVGETTCSNATIIITPMFEAETPANQQNAITHEVGHCLGLQHIDHPGIMNAYGGELSGWDMLELWRVHPRPWYKTTLPMVTHG